jgi:hypothetical protein
MTRITASTAALAFGLAFGFALVAAPLRAADDPMSRAAAAAGPRPWPDEPPGAAQATDDLYRKARQMVDQGQFDRAIEEFTRLAATERSRADAALYWKAYSQSRLGERAEALVTLADLYKEFAASPWLKDARALDVEIRQASGQAVSPDSQPDQELKLLALRGIMQSDPERGLPLVEQMLAGDAPVKLKEQALFVLSQSDSPKARQAIAGIAKNNGNPDLQRRAVRYLGVMGGDATRQLLADVYAATSDTDVKQAVLRSFMVAGDRARLLALAKSERNPELRGDAARQLGVMGAHAEVAELYRTESSPEVKKKILQAMFVGSDADALIAVAKTETDPDLRAAAVRDLGVMKAERTGAALQAIYASDAPVAVRKAAIQGLFVQNNAHALVALARAEKDPELKKEIVSKLSVMHSKEATDYLLELLK